MTTAARTPTTDKTLALYLDSGAHDTREQGMCLLEAVAYIADEPHSDYPKCVSPVLGAFGRRLNDALPDEKRQQLRPLIPKLIGTAGDGLDEQRGYLALDWLIRTFTPAWLDLAGLTDQAHTLRNLRRITDLSAAQTAGPVVRESREKAAAARVAARAAAFDAAGVAARVAAGDAAWAAAWDAASDAARSAAWAAAFDAVRVAARDAVGDAARVAAWDAARDDAGDAARDDAGDAGSAARDALQPTVDHLHDSAIVLYASMIQPEVTP